MNYLDILCPPLSPAVKIKSVITVHILNQAGVIMTALSAIDKATATYGDEATRLRKVMNLTRRQVAVMAHVSEVEVGLFERNQPVRLDARRRILKELWAARSNGII